MIPVPLVDSFQRRARDLRISITDRCNFRCTYCMPSEGMVWLDRDELLTYEEQTRVARVCVERFGFDSVRVTGGEPTIRAHLPRLFELLKPLGVDLAMTTNGVRLPALAHDLAAAGLRRVNVSLDSLRPETFRALTRRDELDQVLAGIDAALDAGLDPVKVNCVVIRGVNDDEVVDLAAYGRARGVGIRFIEFMPLDAPGEWSMDQVVPAAEILERIDRVFPLADRGGPVDHVEPAAVHRYADDVGDVGCHRQRHRAVLRRLRPGADHRRRALPHLPVRARRDRPPGHPAIGPSRRGHRHRGRGGDLGRGERQVGRASDRSGRLRPPGAVHEPDRRLRPPSPPATPSSWPETAGPAGRPIH